MHLRNWTCVLVRSLTLEIGNFVSAINVMKCLCSSIALNIAWQIVYIVYFCNKCHEMSLLVYCTKYCMPNWEHCLFL